MKPITHTALKMQNTFALHTLLLYICDFLYRQEQTYVLTIIVDTLSFHLLLSKSARFIFDHIVSYQPSSWRSNADFLAIKKLRERQVESYFVDL